MSEYQCSSCGAEYSFNEYKALDRTPVDPDEEDPMEGQGYVAVCECGHRFHLDDWQEIDEVTHGDREFTVSTVHLGLNHGHGGRDLWYETLVGWDSGNYITDRYTTQEEAEEGHAETVEKIKTGAYELQDAEYASLTLSDGGIDA